MKANANTFNGFSKSERLTEKKLISQIFKEGKSIFLYPILIKYLPVSDKQQQSNRVLISVSSRKIKHAVDRNLLKRRIREAYRTNKLKYNFTNHYLMAYIYVSNEISTYNLIESKLRESLERLSKSVKETNHD